MREESITRSDNGETVKKNYKTISFNKIKIIHTLETAGVIGILAGVFTSISLLHNL